MDEMIQQKLGEALAYCSFAQELLENGEAGFKEVKTDEELAWQKNTITKHITATQELADDMGMIDEVEECAEQTEEKVRAMSDVFIEDQWDDPARAIGFMSMVNGVSSVTWTFLAAAAEATDNEKLAQLSRQAVAFHEEALDKAKEAAGRLAEKLEAE